MRMSYRNYYEFELHKSLQRRLVLGKFPKHFKGESLSNFNCSALYDKFSKKTLCTFYLFAQNYE